MTNQPIFFSEFTSFSNPNCSFYTQVQAISASSYSVVGSDLGSMTVFNNATGIAVSLPTPVNTAPVSSGGTGVPSVLCKHWGAEYLNLGAGNATFTPPSGVTINGATSLAISQNQGCKIKTDGVKYYAALTGPGGGSSGVSSVNGETGTLNITAGAGISVTPSGSNIQIDATGSGGTFSPDTSAFTQTTPTPYAGSGSFTSASCTMRTKLLSAATKVCLIAIEVDITTNGSAATQVKVGLPYTPKAEGLFYLFGMEKNVSGKLLKGYINASVPECQMTNYDNTYPGQNGAKCCVAGYYEVI